MFCIIIILNPRRIIDIFKRAYFAEVKTPLGRWNIHNYKQTALKIRYANEDNCGTCGTYNPNTRQIQENNEYEQNPESESDKLYIYMMGLDSVPDNAHIIR